MRELIKLRVYCEDKIIKYPELKEEITDLYILAKNEIESGESPSNECYLAENSIEELIKNL